MFESSYNFPTLSNSGFELLVEFRTFRGRSEPTQPIGVNLRRSVRTYKFAHGLVRTYKFARVSLLDVRTGNFSQKGLFSLVLTSGVVLGPNKSWE